MIGLEGTGRLDVVSVRLVKQEPILSGHKLMTGMGGRRQRHSCNTAHLGALPRKTKLLRHVRLEEDLRSCMGF